MVVVNAGVDDGDLDPGAGQAGRVPGLRRADVRHALGQLGLIGRDEVDPRDSRQPGQSRKGCGGNVDVDAVIGILQLRHDESAGLVDGVHDRRLVRLDLRPPGILLGRGEGRARVFRVADLGRDGLVRQLDHDVDDTLGIRQGRKDLRIDLADVDALEARGSAGCHGGSGYGRSEYECQDGQSGERSTSHPTPPVENLMRGLRWPHDRRLM